MTIQSIGESLMFLARASTVYNNKMEEAERTTGSQIFA